MILLPHLSAAGLGVETLRRSGYACVGILVPYADTRSSPAPAGTGLVKFVRLGGQAAFAVA